MDPDGVVNEKSHFCFSFIYYANLETWIKALGADDIFRHVVLASFLQKKNSLGQDYCKNKSK